MSLATPAKLAPAQADLPASGPSHSLRPLLVAVLAAKLAVAAVLVGCAAMAPTVAADGGYFVSD
ncbi:hypothetical protein SAMN05880590_102670 [Rhizobium sp. RU35A]|uniref:hypothetical protein n=1 Tax=Rhizobium sp. RU35A TaxID=1907414 RepID=UPI00095735C8|nr:hypothetical protein [Rhizobium sp. RU35A]SIQ22554.1 hypothetical protein SAMN05880590_102670 [Rhizobium sp. RU35A]